MGKIELYAIVIVAGMASLVGTYFYGRHDGAVIERVKWEEAAAKQAEKEAKRAASASQDREKDREKTRVVYRTITQNVDKIVDRPVYRNVCLDDDGLRLANAALSGAFTAAREPDRRLPAPDAASGRKLGNGAKETDRGK